MMKNRADDFTDMTDYVQTFGEKLGVIDRISTRILKEHYGQLRIIKCSMTFMRIWFKVVQHA